MDDELRAILEKHLALPESERPDTIVIKLKPVSSAERRSYIDASDGLLDGNLLPLASHIRAGYHLGDTLAEQLAEAIEGPDENGFTLKMIGRKGQLRFSERNRIESRKLEMALAVWLRQKAADDAGERGVYAAILLEVAQGFSVSESTVKAAVAEFRSVLNG